MTGRYAKDAVRWLERLNRLVLETHKHATVVPFVVQNEIELIFISWHGGRFRAAMHLLRVAAGDAWSSATARFRRT